MDPTKLDSTLYKKLVGILIHLSYTRLDNNFTVRIIFDHMNFPIVMYRKVVKRIMSYVQDTVDLGVDFVRNNCYNFTIFTYVDWVGSSNDINYTSILIQVKYHKSKKRLQ